MAENGKPCRGCEQTRRSMLTKLAVGSAVAWTAPAVSTSNAFAQGTCSCSVAQGPVQLLTFQPQVSVGGPCDPPKVAATETICRATPDQTMELSRNAIGGALADPYFDELAVITVTAPSTAAVTWNFIRWQADCADPGATMNVTLTGDLNTATGPALDITDMFGSECGDFSIDIAVRNFYAPYGWADTWIVPG